MRSVVSEKDGEYGSRVGGVGIQDGRLAEEERARFQS
jgi:hypothetical protein